MRVQVPLSLQWVAEWLMALVLKTNIFFESIVGSNPTSFIYLKCFMSIKKINFVINFIELKFRVIYFLISWILTFLICFEYRVELFFSISKFFLRIHGHFIYTGLFDPLLVYFKLSLLFSFFLIFPIFVYLFGFFFFKSFYSRYMYLYLFLINIFYLITIFFYQIVLNFILVFFFQFLLLFQRNSSNTSFQLYLEATIVQYYSLYINIFFIYLTIILIPIIFLLLTILNVITSDYFLSFSYRKYIYLSICILFLLVAPPDITIQLVIFPLLFFTIEIYLYITTFYYLLYTFLTSST